MSRSLPDDQRKLSQRSRILPSLPGPPIKLPRTSQEEVKWQQAGREQETATGSQVGTGTSGGTGKTRMRTSNSPNSVF